jgi:hypothetical protein
MGDCIARRDLPARMVSLMEGDCRERGFVKESGAHARMEGAPRCDIAEGERRDVGLRRRAGGRARAGACRGEETAARRGGEGRSRQGGDLAGLRGQGAGLREGERGTREDGGAPRCEIAEGERRDAGLRRRAGGARGWALAEERRPRQGGEARGDRGGDLAGLREMEGGGCGRREGTRGRRNRDGGGGCGREEGITGGGIRTEEGNRAMAEQGVVHAYTKHIIVVEIYPSIR